MKYYIHLSILFRFDCCPDENYWYITEGKSGKIYLSRSFESESANSFIKEDIMLPADKEYTLTIYDKKSNGLESGEPYYEVYSGKAEEGWIQRALLARVTGNFGFSLEHKIPMMQYQTNVNAVSHNQVQYEYYSRNAINEADLIVMLTCFITFLAFGFVIGVRYFGSELLCNDRNHKGPLSTYHSQLFISTEDDENPQEEKCAF